MTRKQSRIICIPMIETDLISLGFLPAAFFALVAGALSFLSPCVLPIVPPYLAYMSGVSIDELNASKHRWRTLITSLMFVLGLSTVFLLFGFAASQFGRAIIAYQSTLNTLSGVLVMIFGLHFLRIIRIGILDSEMRLDAQAEGGKAFGAYILGLAFAFGWTPCIGPQLSAILSLAAQEASASRGTALLGIYALGLGVPFILTAAFLSRLTTALTWFKKHLEVIERIMGLLLWTVGLMILTGGFASLSFWLLEAFPILVNLG